MLSCGNDKYLGANKEEEGEFGEREREMYVY